MAEVMKQKKDLAILKMQEDEAIIVYTFQVVVPSLFGGKRTTKSDISYLPKYEKWRDKILNIGLGYELEKMLYLIHCDIKLIPAEKYQRHPYLKVLATEMSLRQVQFVSALIRWVDGTYESFLAGGNVKEDVWWITTMAIRLIFGEYLDPARTTPTRTSFGSYPHRRITLVSDVICYHLAEENIL